MTVILPSHPKKVLLAVNKIDGPEMEVLTADFHRLGLDTVFAVSAAHGYGVKTLMQNILAHLPKGEPPEPDDRRIRVVHL